MPDKTVFITAAVTLVVTLVIMNLVTTEKKVGHRVTSLYGTAEPQFERVMANLLGPGFVSGNRVEQLLNGDCIFPSMLEAVRSAQHSICFETYIYWSGRIGEEFSQALGERARAGVKVHLLVDWMGSAKMDDALLSEMTEAGVELERFRPLRFYNLSRMNNRTHRKILVVDGRVGFTGGVGVADHWLGDARTPEEWRDSHFRVEGPAVLQLQSAFMDNWMKARGEVLHGASYFPEAEERGTMAAQVFKSGPSEGADSMRLMYLLAIAAARQSILIENSYFLPDTLAVEMLAAARRRGVRVEVIVPGPRVDTPITRNASRAGWGPLLEAGVEIHEFSPTMFHCKVMVVDGLWTSVGSTNFDPRSFRLNDEANLNVLDADFAARQEAVFAADKARAKRVDLASWRRRPWQEKVKEKAASLVRSQL